MGIFYLLLFYNNHFDISYLILKVGKAAEIRTLIDTFGECDPTIKRPPYLATEVGIEPTNS